MIRTVTPTQLSTTFQRYGDIRVLNLDDIEKGCSTLLQAFLLDTLGSYLVSHMSNPAMASRCHYELYKAYIHQHIVHGIVVGAGESEHSFETVAIWTTPESSASGIDGFAAMCEAGYGKVWDAFGPIGRDKVFKGMIPLLHNTADRILGSDSRFCDKKVYCLVYVGSLPRARGKGNLRKMFNFMFDRYIDVSSDTICYLESSSTANIPIYNRFGFHRVQDITLGKSDVPHAKLGKDFAVMTVMIRGNRGLDWRKHEE